MQDEVFQNLVYALIQAGHNIGAVVLFGGYIASLLGTFREKKRALYALVFTGWLIQGLSGSLFGAASYTFYGKFPDIGQIGMTMLAIKIFCVAGGFSIVFILILLKDKINEATKKVLWQGSFGLAVTALICAAFLRWFS